MSTTQNDARVVLVVPAYNEAGRLPALLEALSRTRPDLRVVVVDDGSRDETSAAARRAGARVLRHPFNLGYGAALQTGYKYALRSGAEFVAQMDADGQHLPEELPGLLQPVLRGECDLCLGSRFLSDADSAGYEMGPLRSLGRGVFRGIARIAGLELSDPTSGLQAMNRKVLELYVSERYPYDFPDVDVLLWVHREGLRIREQPVRMAQSSRPSTLHSGWAPLYYAYRLLLALWSLSGDRRTRGSKG